MGVGGGGVRKQKKCYNFHEPGHFHRCKIHIMCLCGLNAYMYKGYIKIRVTLFKIYCCVEWSKIVLQNLKKKQNLLPIKDLKASLKMLFFYLKIFCCTNQLFFHGYFHILSSLAFLL